MHAETYRLIPLPGLYHPSLYLSIERIIPWRHFQEGYMASLVEVGGQADMSALYRRGRIKARYRRLPIRV